MFVKNWEGRECWLVCGDWAVPAGETSLAEVIDVELFDWSTLGATKLVPELYFEYGLVFSLLKAWDVLRGTQGTAANRRWKRSGARWVTACSLWRILGQRRGSKRAPPWLPKNNCYKSAGFLKFLWSCSFCISLWTRASWLRVDILNASFSFRKRTVDTVILLTGSWRASAVSSGLREYISPWTILGRRRGLQPASSQRRITTSIAGKRLTCFCSAVIATNAGRKVETTLSCRLFSTTREILLFEGKNAELASRLGVETSKWVESLV